MNANLTEKLQIKVTNKTKLNYRSNIKIGVKEFFGQLSANTELPKKKLGSSATTEVITIFEESSVTDIVAQPVEEDTFAQNKVTISHSCMAGYKSKSEKYGVAVQ